MKTIKTGILMFCFTIIVNAQIPNAGFEDWIDETTPQNWVTNNLLSSWNTVIRSSDSYSGSYAAQIQIAEYFSIPVYPTLTITFPVNQAYGAINGYYQLHQVNNQGMLVMYTFYFANGNLVGSNGIELEVASSTYLPFSLDLELGNITTLDSIWVQMQMISNSDTDPGIGAYAIVDDLSLGSQVTEVKQVLEIPSEYSLRQNYPNPFNPSTIIEFSIPKASHVVLKVFNILGKEIRTLANDNYAPGTYKEKFDGASLPSGIYFARIRAGNYAETKKMILTK